MRDTETQYAFVEQDWPSACPESAAHKEPITSISGIPGDRYATTSRDGTIKFWSTVDHTVLKTLRVSRAWVTDIAYITTGNKLAASSFNRSIQLFDAGDKLEVIGRLTDLDHVPMTLDTWRSDKKALDNLLSGDTGGYVRVYTLKEKIEDDMLHMHDRVNIHQIWSSKPHSDWVSRARYIADLNSIVSCSLDKVCSATRRARKQYAMQCSAVLTACANAFRHTPHHFQMICVTDVERRLPTRTLAGHHKSVYAFDWSKTYKFIASCGMEYAPTQAFVRRANAFAICVLTNTFLSPYCYIATIQCRVCFA